MIGADVTGGVVLRWKHIATLRYGYGAWDFAFLQNFYTGYRTGDRQLDGEPNFVKDQSIFDFYMSYTGIKNLTAGARREEHLRPRSADLRSGGQSVPGGYDASLYDPRSRFVYGSINYKFY